MRVEGLSRSVVGDRTRIQARVVYEDTDLPGLDLYYEAAPPLADALQATPEAFAVAVYALACWEGERRLKIEGTLDGTLAGGLHQMGKLLDVWYERCRPVPLEPTQGYRAVWPESEQRPMSLFTGGVDGMAVLCENRRVVPQDHPAFIRTVLYAFGYAYPDMPDGVESPFKRARYEAQAARIEAMGARLGFDLVRLDSNQALLHPSNQAYFDATHIGRFLPPFLGSPRFVTEALIGSNGEGGAGATPHGSHPLLDPHYSTAAVRVRNVHPVLTRSEKLRMLSDWEPAFDSLAVCHGGTDTPTDVLNCGKCEKCVHTMLGLLTCGALERFTVFPYDDVTPEMIDGIRIQRAHHFLTLPDMQANLARIGRQDLLDAIQRRVAVATEGRLAKTGRKWRRSLAKRLGRHQPRGS